MINFRKIKQEYAPSSLKEGKALLDERRVKEVRLSSLNDKSVRIWAKVDSPYATSYRCELEIDLHSSNIRDSDCDCPHKYDCHHLAALLFHLEEHLDELVLEHVQENGQKERPAKGGKRQSVGANSWAKEHWNKKQAKELIEEVIAASKIFGESSLFFCHKKREPDPAKLAILFKEGKKIELQIALRLEDRVKPFLLPNIAEFFEAAKAEIPFQTGGKTYFITSDSFAGIDKRVFLHLVQAVEYKEFRGTDRVQKLALMDSEDFGTLLALVFEEALRLRHSIEELPYEVMSSLYIGNFDEPLKCSVNRASFQFYVEKIQGRAPKAHIRPKVVLEQDLVIDPSDATFYESSSPGLIYRNVYYCFEPQVRRRHLRALSDFEELIIPEPLFGTLLENSIPALEKLGKVILDADLEVQVTLPYVRALLGECHLGYEGEELEAKLFFHYDGLKVPASSYDLQIEHCLAFITPEGIRARNIAEEQEIIRTLFSDFFFDGHKGAFLLKNDKKIIEFMTVTIPENSHRIQFITPDKLKKRFLYNETKFFVSARESSRIDTFFIELKTEGSLKDVYLDTLWDCLLSSRNFIELEKGVRDRRGESHTKHPKILVFDLKKLEPLIHVFDEVGITVLSDHVEERPLFHLSSLRKELFKDLPIEFSISEKLQEIQQRLIGEGFPEASPIPTSIQASLRPYQKKGVEWLEKLRYMHLAGILADDMGLGKTIQAITALSQYLDAKGMKCSLVVAPTSLLFNWQEEVQKFNPKIRVRVITGSPDERRELIESENKYDLLITSYSLVQRDIEWIEKKSFGYLMLDEAQHIKNRTTRNARSVKQIKADHRLVLTGTPIENSLEELWSLFDFLMPGFLSTYDRFLEKYVKNPVKEKSSTAESLRARVGPFILRRMKTEVLKELPEATELFYHCRLNPLQQELYYNFAQNARKELSALVQKQGFEKAHIQILATLTRLKQICCHPALFAKEKAERGDSAKYEMFLDLLEGLIEGGHRTVVFSQYTKMLEIMRSDLMSRSIPFEYLDGTTKDRLGIVKKFNEDENIPVFLVSLKAGGSGLNLVGADTVIHYDLSWNPAVENQAKDRVHRIGQKNAVSCFRLITLDTIEEKILALQNRKKKLVLEVISSDEEAATKLTWETWEEALSLIQ